MIIIMIVALVFSVLATTTVIVADWRDSMKRLIHKMVRVSVKQGNLLTVYPLIKRFAEEMGMADEVDIYLFDRYGLSVKDI